MLSVIERCVSEQQIKARYVVVTLSVPYFNSVPPCGLRQPRGANSAKFSFTAQTGQRRRAALCRTLSHTTPTKLTQTKYLLFAVGVDFPEIHESLIFITPAQFAQDSLLSFIYSMFTVRYQVTDTLSGPTCH